MCAVTRCSRCRRTRAWSASTSSHLSAWRSPSTATAGTAGWTRTRAPSSRWRKPTATLRRPWRGRPPVVDLEAERGLAAVLAEAGRRGLLEAAHDLSDGGLAIALAECCLAGGQGCAVQLQRPGRLPGKGAEFTLLFGESAARAVV